MKYLLINSVAGSGSTGRIAAEKCRELQKKGHQCILAYGRRKTNCNDIETLRIGTPFDYILHGIKTRVFDQHGFG
ncbi:MAG: glycosyl transferase, partial [Lachnospiraceae bacterium]|nr:glycosyl transferase [Lachnospiraceae bacterium]